MQASYFSFVEDDGEEVGAGAGDAFSNHELD